MNILIENDDNGVGTAALARGFVQLGHDAALWVPSKMTTHEAFARQKPDLFIGPTSALTAALMRNQGKCRLALWQDDTTFLNKLPPGAFLFTTDDNDQGLPVIPWPFLALDKEKLYTDDLATDVVFLDEYRAGYDPFFVPLFENENFVARVYSDKPWPVPYYAGSLTTEERVRALASTYIHAMSADDAKDIRKVYETLRVGAIPAIAGDTSLPTSRNSPEAYLKFVKDTALSSNAERQEIFYELVDLFIRRTPVDSAEALLRAMVTC